MALFDLSPAVLLLSSGTYVVTRRPAGTYTKGARVVTGTGTQLTITASVQPATGLQVNRLPEGKRNSEAIAIYTPTELYPLIEDTWLPDTLVVDGSTFEVDNVQRWSPLGNYYECVAVKTLAPPVT